jgi:hypothetical protein
MEELYFCLHLTENEHYLAEFKEQCDFLGLEVKYYRKLKDGHVPMFREVKIVGDKLKINLFKKYMRMRSRRKQKVDKNVEVLLKVEADTNIMLNYLPWPIPGEAREAYDRIIDNLMLLEIGFNGNKNEF